MDGAAGDKIVIEKRIFGPEISYHALLDGRTFCPPGPPKTQTLARWRSRTEHRRHGRISPPIEVTEALEQRILRDVVAKVVVGMAAEGVPFRGTFLRLDAR